MNDHELFDSYEAALRRTENKRTEPVLPPERLAALVNRTGDESERLRALDLAMSSEAGRREFEVSWAAGRAAREYDQSQQKLRRRPLWLAIAAVLLVSVVSGTLLLKPGVTASDAEPLRGADSPLPLVSPRTGNVERRGLRFVWHGVPSVREYTLILVDSGGKEMFAQNTRDTALTLPDSIQLTAGTQYLWWVQATRFDGSTLSAVTERIRISADR